MKRLPRFGRDDDAAFEQQARFARMMGHPVRLKMLHLLHKAGEPVPSQALLEVLDITAPALSQHLARMSDVGLVRTQRDGQRVSVELASPEVGEACELVRSSLAKRARKAAKALTTRR